MTGGLLAILLAFTAVTVAPGPANLAVGLTAMARGWRAALPMALGLALGLALWGLVAALGLGAVLAQSELALIVLRLAGGGYLLWLACKTGRAALAPESGDVAPTDGAFRRVCC